MGRMGIGKGTMVVGDMDSVGGARRIPVLLHNVWMKR